MNDIQKGAIAELKAAIRAVENGISASVPIVSTLYDLILEKNGKMYRTEVKTLVRHRKGTCGWLQSSVCHEVSHCYKLVKRTYTYYYDGKVDLFLLYHRQEDVFFVIPADVLAKHKAVGIGKKSKYLKYKEAWNLIG